MQETVSGIRVRGQWKEVVNIGEEVTRILEESSETRSEHLDEWEEWRPRESERLEEEHREKTVEKAVTSEGPAERQGKGVTEQAEEAVGEVEEAVGRAVKGEIDTASRKTRDAVFEAFLSLDVALRKTFRRFESFVYRHLTSRASPHYFDSEMVSASLSRKKSLHSRFKGREDDMFEMTVAINDDGVKEELKRKIQESDN